MNKLELKNKINNQLSTVHDRPRNIEYGEDEVGLASPSLRIYNDYIVKAWNVWVDKNFSSDYQVSEYFLGNKGDDKNFTDEEIEYICTELLRLFFSNQDILDMINIFSGGRSKFTSNNLIDNYEVKIDKKEDTIHDGTLYSMLIFNNYGQVIREVWFPVKHNLRNNLPMKIAINNNDYRTDNIGDHVINFMLMILV